VNKPATPVTATTVSPRTRSIAQITVLFMILIVFDHAAVRQLRLPQHPVQLRQAVHRPRRRAARAVPAHRQERHRGRRRQGPGVQAAVDARNDFARAGATCARRQVHRPAACAATVRDEMERGAPDWENLRKNTDTILASEQTVLSLHQVAATLAETVPQLQVEYEKVVEILLQRGAPASQVAVAQRQLLLAERILGSVNTVLAGDESAVQAADAFGRDARRFGQVLNGMLNGNATIQVTRSKTPMPARGWPKSPSCSSSLPARWTKFSKPRPNCSVCAKPPATSSACRKPCSTKPRTWPTVSKTWPAGAPSTPSAATCWACWRWPRSSSSAW
jgi:twitching motility protein PilJ